ncbi:cytochrome P450 [Kitasatospora indigofera]|uniref:Cytochrome P450 n=1 Tax=Kitasatospora indigofera TaxID=67307 RepID=A0A919FTF3_9ACTN|nr:cytochrome P450 [Kitasatospora indigofera]GHH71145.1 cytochrome P450 [Kitasatospora indigofera]
MTAPLVGPYATPRRAQRTARRRDRRVYLRSHPVLFALLAATRRRPVVRIGRTVLVHGTEAYREVLTRVPLDRTAEGTTGGAAARLTDGGLLFDQDGAGHRAARRALSADLGSGAVARLRPLWQGVLDERLAVLDPAGPTPDGRPRDGRATVDLPTVDLVELARELAGVTTAALTACAADPLLLARAAADAAAATARDHLPGPRRPGSADAAARAAAGLTALLPDSLDAMLAVAAVNTTVAALPRAAAWCADAGLWAGLTPATAPALAAELLRLTAPSPVLPRVAAADATVAGCPVARGDRLVLVARHAARAQDDTPADPAAATQAVFGAGPHACPGAGLARAQLADLLLALAPYRPVVVRARVDRRSALPGYAELRVRAGLPAGAGPPSGPARPSGSGLPSGIGLPSGPARPPGTEAP